MGQTAPEPGQLAMRPWDQGFFNGQPSANRVSEALAGIAIPPGLDWLRTQTILTSVPRQRMLEALPPLHPWQSVLDAGSGLGAMALELALRTGCQVVGIDSDPEALQCAARLAEALTDLSPDVRWMQAAAEDLPFASGQFDGITARFLLQHVPAPDRFVTEAQRVLKPSGWLFIEEVDDGLTLEYPEPPPGWQQLLDAFRQLQALNGGDRRIGRKLGPRLKDAGFTVDVRVVSQSQVGRVDQTDPALAWEIRRVADAVPAMIKAGLIAPGDFENGQAALLAAHPRTTFVTNATIQLLARKSAAGLA